MKLSAQMLNADDKTQRLGNSRRAKIEKAIFRKMKTEAAMSKEPRLFVLFQERPPLGPSKPVRHYWALTQFGGQFLFAEKSATKLTAAEVRTIRRQWAESGYPVRVRFVGKGLGDDFKPVAQSFPALELYRGI